MVKHKLLKVYATTSTVSASDTITGRFANNYGNASCSAVYSNETALQHCMLTWFGYQCKFGDNFDRLRFTR